MEGTQGITIDAPMPVMPAASKGIEKGTSTTAPTNAEGKPVEATESATEENQETTKSQDQNGEQQEDTSMQEPKTEEEMFDEKREQILDGFEQLGEHLGDELKDQLFNSYFSELLSKDKKEGKGSKFVETFAEMIRMLKLIIAIILLQITHPEKVTFSGKDLNLSDSPPEGEDTNPLTKLINGKDSRESWNEFREEVDAIENVPFGTFMQLVLAANEKHSIKQYRAKKEGGKSLRGMPRGHDMARRKNTVPRRAAARRAA